MQRFHFEDPPAPPAPPPPVSRWEAAGVAADRTALLAGVVAAPDDDLPRLVYADWLEEHGDPARAEFIRVQCRIAERERTAPVPEGDPDRRRETELRNAHGRDWRDELPAVRGIEWASYAAEWWRGFTAVRVQSATTLVRSHARLAAAGPVEKVVFWNRTTDARDFSALLKSPVVDGLRVLVLIACGFEHRGELGAFRELFASPRLARLHGLVLQSCSSDGLPAVAAAEHLSALEWLDAGHLDGAAAALAASTGLPAVRWVRLAHKSSYNPAVRRALAERFAHVVYHD